MNNYYIFVDCDGTLTNCKNEITDITIEMINNIQKLGCKVILCTGRSEAELEQKILDIKFDGIVGSSGAYAIIKDKKLFHYYIEKEDLVKLIDTMNSNEIYYYLESTDGMFATKGFIKEISKVIPMIDFDLSFQSIKECDLKHVSKISYCHSKLSHKELETIIDSKFRVYEDSFTHRDDSGEIGLKFINKATAIDEVLNYYGCKNPFVIAIGDGDNDLDMFERANYAIAMGNANEKVKSNANYITLDNNNDGLAYVLENIIKAIKKESKNE